jgi:hypothetical protein
MPITPFLIGQRFDLETKRVLVRLGSRAARSACSLGPIRDHLGSGATRSVSMRVREQVEKVVSLRKFWGATVRVAPKATGSSALPRIEAMCEGTGCRSRRRPPEFNLFDEPRKRLWRGSGG